MAQEWSPIIGYRVVVEVRGPGAGGRGAGGAVEKVGTAGHIIIRTEAGEHTLSGVKSYSELAALAEILRNEKGLHYQPDGRILHVEWQPPGSQSSKDITRKIS